MSRSEWRRALSFANEWGFDAVIDVCAKGLASNSDTPPTTVSQTLDISENNASSVLPLVLRKAPLTADDVKRLGPDTSSKVSHTRELVLRGRIEDSSKLVHDIGRKWARSPTRRGGHLKG